MFNEFEAEIMVHAKMKELEKILKKRFTEQEGKWLTVLPDQKVEA
ncbi:hypothetical protein [Bacillus sp. MUM 13]|nr:hypothetical protein [Bacillus sp. MUM 13]